MGFFDKQVKKTEQNFFTQIADFLTGKGIAFTRNPNDDAMFSFDSNVNERVIHCILVCDLSTKLITFVAYVQDEIPKDRFPEILEFIARMNKDIWYGSFQINFETGRVRCKTTLVIDNATISCEQLERLCFNNLLHIYNYQDGFSNIICNNVSP